MSFLLPLQIKENACAPTLWNSVGRVKTRVCLAIEGNDKLSEQFRFAVKPAPDQPTDYLSKRSAFCVINGKNYWVKINSLAKRLGISASTIRNNVYFYGPQSWLTHTLLANAQIKAANLKQIIGDKSPVTVEELEQIVRYVNDHPDQKTDQVRGPLARTIGFKEDGSRWIHLSRYKLGDLVAGRGCSKTAKYTVNIDTGEIAIRTTESCCNHPLAKQWHEIKMIRLLQENNVPNIVKIYHVQIKPSKQLLYKGHRFEVIKELCPGGELCEFKKRNGVWDFGIDHNGIAIDPVKFIEKLFDTVMAMAKLNIFIKDLKLANVLVSKSGDPVIADFGEAVKCKPNDMEFRKNWAETIESMKMIIDRLFSTYYKKSVKIELSWSLEGARENFRKLVAELSKKDAPLPADYVSTPR